MINYDSVLERGQIYGVIHLQLILFKKVFFRIRVRLRSNRSAHEEKERENNTY